MPKADKSISKIMGPLASKFGAGRSGLVEHWQDIAGTRFARISTPLRFQGGRDGRTLLIAAPGPAAALIMASGQSIIDKVNAYLGPDYIRHIKVIQTKMRDGQLAGGSHHKSSQLSPGDQRRLEDGLTDIQDDELKNALEKLGRHVISRQKKGSS